MRRRRTPVPGRDGYLRAWSVTHGGYDPATGGVLVRRWLGLTYLFARPLAALGTPPAAVTAVGGGGGRGRGGGGGRRGGRTDAATRCHPSRPAPDRGRSRAEPAIR
ncbi:hypothetical protein [Frankia sp. AgB1.8]|uniref:hypothetical protein n=1 Tax=Frankia sp. AgB1.8 TaxID=2792839 RepID=UPI001EE42991|nr:hypothetical protein [Frankia sp. AgB1.8]